MTVTTPGRADLEETLTTGDGTPLKLALSQAMRRARVRAFLLVAPLLLFVLITFAVPIGQMLYLSINNPIFSDNMPRVTAYLKTNPIKGVPGEEAFTALALDLVDAKKNRTAARVGVRVNYSRPGSTSLFKSSARQAVKFEGPPYKEKFLEFNKDWDDLHLWRVIERAASSQTMSFYAAALDLTYDANGDLVRAHLGPARKSSSALVGMYKDGKTKMGPHMPTAPANMKNALVNNFAFWADHSSELNERFNAWITAN